MVKKMPRNKTIYFFFYGNTLARPCYQVCLAAYVHYIRTRRKAAAYYHWFWNNLLPRVGLQRNA